MPAELERTSSTAPTLPIYTVESAKTVGRISCGQYPRRARQPMGCQPLRPSLSRAASETEDRPGPLLREGICCVLVGYVSSQSLK